MQAYSKKNQRVMTIIMVRVRSWLLLRKVPSKTSPQQRSRMANKSKARLRSRGRELKRRRRRDRQNKPNSKSKKPQRLCSQAPPKM
jgi:hypothetical protein